MLAISNYGFCVILLLLHSADNITNGSGNLGRERQKRDKPVYGFVNMCWKINFYMYTNRKRRRDTL